MINEQIEELQSLVSRVIAAEELLQLADAFLCEHRDKWHPAFTAHFEDTLSRKKEAIEYGWHLVHKVGLTIALKQGGVEYEDLLDI